MDLQTTYYITAVDTSHRPVSQRAPQSTHIMSVKKHVKIGLYIAENIAIHRDIFENCAYR